MSRALIAIVGLVLLALLGWFCVGQHAPAIEADLGARTAAALRAGGDQLTEVIVDGRDITLTGNAPDAAASAALARTAADVRGVRTVNNRLQLAAAPVAAPPYRTGLRLEQGRLRLIGSVPSAAARERLLAQAREAQPDATIDDALDVVDGASDDWEQTMAATMPAFAQLREGLVDLTDSALTVTGSARVGVDPLELRSALASGLPADINASYQIAATQPSAADTAAAAAATAAAETAAASSCQDRFNALLGREAVQFESSEATIKAVSHPLLNEIADIAKTCPSARIEIAGHTDSSGAAEFNKRLSERRAEAVRRYLVDSGVAPQRLRSAGYGEELPKVSNETAAGRATNRRVELIVEGV